MLIWHEKSHECCVDKQLWLSVCEYNFFLTKPNWDWFKPQVTNTYAREYENMKV